MKKRLLSIILAVMLVLSLVACGDTSNQTAADGTTNSGTSDNTTTTNTPPAEDDSADYAFVIKPLSNEFWATMKEGVEAKAKELGVKVDIYAVENESDVQAQANLMENVMSKGYKAICVTPISDTNMLQPIAKATEEGIYVISVDLMPDMEALRELGGALYSFVAADNVQIGGLGGKYIADQVGTEGGQVAIILGITGNAAGEGRSKGAREAMLAAGLEIVEEQPADYDRTKAYDVATNLLSKYPDLKGIYCCNDSMALGAVEAVKNAGSDCIIVGTDGTEEALTSIENGELGATVAQDPAGMGARGLEMMIEAVESGAAIDPAVDPIMEGVDSYLVSQK